MDSRLLSGWTPAFLLLAVLTAVAVIALVARVGPNRIARPASGFLDARLRAGVRGCLNFAVQSLLRVRATGTENLPPTGRVLLLANHISYADAVVLQAVTRRSLRFLAASQFLKNPFLRLVYRLFAAIPVDPNNPRQALRQALAALEADECVCLFPEGRISETGQLQTLREGYALLARRSGAPVVPVHIDGLAGTIFAKGGGRRARLIEKGRRGVRLTFGSPLPTAASAEVLTAALSSPHGPNRAVSPDARAHGVVRRDASAAKQRPYSGTCSKRNTTTSRHQAA